MVAAKLTWLPFLVITLSPLPTRAERPNVVVLLSDDQGWGDLSHTGNTDISTPNIDSLAAAGASLDRFFVSPVCSPTRAEFLTGRHHADLGVYSTSAGGERMDLDATTIAELFQSAGYVTAAFGKWHNGMQYPYHPNGRGFDEFYGFCSGHWGNYFSPLLEHNGRMVQGDGFCVDDFTNRAIDFVETAVDSGRPWFVYLPYNTPHSPMQVPDRFWHRLAHRRLNLKNEQQTEPQPDTHKRCALAMCENLDWNVGRLLAKLDALGATRNTIVVWFHDNGPNGVRWNGGMRGRKGSTDEGGVRSPLFLRWPAVIAAGTILPQIATVRDLLPTLCDLAGVPFETGTPLDGVSLKPLLAGDRTPWPQRVLINHWGKQISARNQRFRLDSQGKLYDMVADPGQRTEVTVDHPEVVAQLTAAKTAHRDRFMPAYYEDERPFVIAHPGSPFTQIPARDGVAHGSIQRSNRYPNCSYFKNWTSTADRITWSVSVGAGGLYRVNLYYAAKDAGAKCELRFRNAVLPFQITESHDVVELGGEYDRHPRQESYIKDFKVAAIGEWRLEKGDGELTLLATEIPGETAMEFRMLTLARVE